jgi:hypothetical protein
MDPVVDNRFATLYFRSQLRTLSAGLPQVAMYLVCRDAPSGSSLALPLAAFGTHLFLGNWWNGELEAALACTVAGRACARWCRATCCPADGLVCLMHECPWRVFHPGSRAVCCQGGLKAVDGTGTGSPACLPA